MDITKLLLLALGIQPEQVLVESYQLELDNLTAVIVMRQKRVSCKCPECGGSLYGVKQWRMRKLWGVPLGALLRVRIIFYRLQGACGSRASPDVAAVFCISDCNRRVKAY